jgi:L-fuconolactonase
MNRRQFLQATGSAAFASAAMSCGTLHSDAPDSLIIDTHQHLWDLVQIQPPWLHGASEILRRSYTNDDYAKAFAGLNVRSIYMEVDVAPKDHIKEADLVLAQCRAGNTPMIGATIGGRPDAAEFSAYVGRYAGTGFIKGLRQVLHGDATPPGHCLTTNFVQGVRTLGKHGLNFELTLRPTELLDGAKLTEQCPDTSFVLDHCGNGDPKAFNSKLGPGLKRSCTADEWKRGIDAVAKRPNVQCKISGIVAFVPPGEWSAEDLAPVVNHCLDAFGPDRVFFGGDWPVCLLGSPVRGWVEALRQIVAARPSGQQRKLWSGNAIRFYRLKL